MRILIPILLASVVLSACGGGAEPSTTPAPTSVPTDAPAVQSTEPPAQPTEVSAASTEAPAPTTPMQALASEGRISFRDNLAVSDQLVVTMRGIAPPPDGSVYEGWLIADDGTAENSTGVIEVSADGNVDYTWTSPTGDNLIEEYVGFSISVEPADNSDPDSSSEVAFKGTADPGTVAAARRVFAANDGEPATPRNVSYGQGLLTQSQVANSHILNAFNAAAIGAFDEMRTHSEHIINIIEGTAGPRFADYNGDGRSENPGDGFGTLTYAQQISVLIPGLSDAVMPVAELLIGIQDKAEEILAAEDIAAARTALDELKAMGEQLLNDTTPTFYASAQAAVSYPIEPTP